MSMPEMCSSVPSSVPYSTESSRTQDSPIGLGRKGDRVANTPIAVLPPSLGGRTVGDQSPRALSENFHTSHRWE